MGTDVHREEVLLVMLANADIVLDAESIAATYNSDAAIWRASLRALHEKGLVEQVGTGLYSLTPDGERMVLPRGSGHRLDELPLTPSAV